MTHVRRAFTRAVIQTLVAHAQGNVSGRVTNAWSAEDYAAAIDKQLASDGPMNQTERAFLTRVLTE